MRMLAGLTPSNELENTRIKRQEPGSQTAARGRRHGDGELEATWRRTALKPVRWPDLYLWLAGGIVSVYYRYSTRRVRGGVVGWDIVLRMVGMGAGGYDIKCRVIEDTQWGIDEQVQCLTRKPREGGRS